MSTYNRNINNNRYRNNDNYEGWIRVMGDDTDMKFVLFLDLKDESFHPNVCF